MTGAELSSLRFGLAAFLVAFCGMAGAQRATGVWDPQSGSTQLVLESLGYPASEYDVAITWREKTSDASESYVQGYRLRSRANGASIDVYVNADGDVVSPAALHAKGIRPKPWDAPPKQKTAEPVSSARSDAKTLSEPIGPRQALAVSGGVIVPEIDFGQIAAEDAAREANQGKGSTRIGVIQVLDEPVLVEGDLTNYGYWQSTADGGALWSVALYSPDALGMRIHFDRIDLPNGAAVTVYNAGNPGESYGPYPDNAQSATGLWTATCFTDMAVVECVVPASVDRGAVRIAIDQVVHNYVPFGEFARTKAAGNCNLDVACYDNWSSAATGVGGVGTISTSGSFFCSGCLVADTDVKTNIPYFLTANHCVSSGSQAANLEIYWLYQTSTCNGVPPNPRTVPRTMGGAQLLATANASEGTDFTLLRLNNTVPAGLTFLGWSSAATPLATATACVHHPSVDFKRISFGVVTDVSESSQIIRPASRYYQSSWTLGTTEPGSSGSPLFIESTQQVIGQLWGGPGSCTAANNLDYYGRFDVGFPLMAAYLDPDIAPAITVTVPNGGDVWSTAKQHGVRWFSTGNVGSTVRIELWRNGNIIQTIHNGIFNNGSVSWSVDPGLDPGNGYRVRILSASIPAVYDESDAPFSLFTPETQDPPDPPDPAPGQPRGWLWTLIRLLLSLLGFL